MIATSEPGCSIGNSQQRVDLLPAKKVHELLVAPLAGNCEHTLDVRAIGGLFKRDKAEERSDRCQSQVARTGTGGALHLQLLQEGADQSGIELSQLEQRGRLAPLIG